jgi:subtilisin family serine protease
MKMKALLLVVILLMAACSINVHAQVSNDNEDEVYKVERPQAKDFVTGQVLFKLKDGQQAHVRRAAGRVQSTGISSLDKVLKEFGAQEMEQLLPNAKVTGTPRRAKAYNGQTIVERDLTQLYKMTLPEEKMMQTLELVEELKQLDEVEFAEPNYKVYLTETTNLTNCTNLTELSAGDHIADSYDSNPMASQQWYLKNFGVDQLWNKPIINPTRPVIAIIDTGVDLTHPDLKDNLWTNTAEAEGEADYDNDGNGFKGDVHGWDFINNTPNVKDFNMHGTHVAGIAAACNNDIGIVGANPQALIMPVSVMQSDGTGDIATVIKGINYAVANGATVLNLSLGTYAYSSALRQALERAYQKAVIVASAGNDAVPVDPECDRDFPMFPAAYTFVLGVQATTDTGGFASFSNFDCNGANYSSISTLQDPDGFNYELKAPGTNILSTIPGGKYKVLQGTSMAAPLVAGAISVLKMVKDYDIQEVLWGDLLHSSNIAEAYAVVNRPAELDLVNMQFQNRKDLEDETEADYSGDNEIDAGEIVSIYPVIRTTFGEASNIKMHLEMGDEFEDPNTVEIYSDSENKVDFGWHLNAYGRNVSQNPLEFKVPNNVADNRHVKLKFVASCDESIKTFEKPFTIVVSNMVKISGLISDNRTLKADRVYYVNDNLAIGEGATLTIEPGTRIEFAKDKGLSTNGKLIAHGTPQKHIVFTGHNGEVWKGINSHFQSNPIETHSGTIYTNSNMSLFTLKQTEATPEVYSGGFRKTIYIKPGETVRTFRLLDYLPIIDYNYNDMTEFQELLADPNYLTPTILAIVNEWEQYCDLFPNTETAENTVSATCSVELNYGRYGWGIYAKPRDVIKYCKLENYSRMPTTDQPIMYDCVLSPNTALSNNFISSTQGERNTFMNGSPSSLSDYLRNCNIINNGGNVGLINWDSFKANNYFNNSFVYKKSGEYNNSTYWFGVDSTTPYSVNIPSSSYFGSGNEDVIRPFIWEIGNAPTFGAVNLSNLRSTPIAEAHGIVWKVVVNGKDAQDEYEELAPLGVGKHKFEVYFNRPMNKAIAPQISFGVRDPYTQNVVNEDGSWNADGTIYTAYKTITGKTKSDGVNRIYVYGAEDNEYFEIPYEKSRFNIQIQAAGSMASGFMAEAGLGRVNLTWDNSHNDFEDAMGFNIYRYTIDDAGKADTILINTDIVDIEATEFTDYDVTPGTTYYYLYKVLSTDLQEYDVSNVVAATPLTSELGDANGSGKVDVADVITTVNYAAGMEPKPFIFEAADMNSDLTINILDVVGIIQKILHPTAAPVLAMNEAQAVYTIEDGVLYVESPVALAGVQTQLNLDVRSQMDDVRVSEDLNGFEHVTAWLSDNDMLFLAYNMNGKTLTPGKHALLKIGDADVTQIRLSDTQGHNVMVVAGEGATAVDAMGSKVQTQKGVYDLQGRKLSPFNSHLSTLKKGVYIVNGEKVVK